MEAHPRRVGDRLAECATSVLGDAVVGVILHGSATMDDFAPGRSDIDVLVITEGPIDDPVASELLERIASVGRDARTRADMRVVTRKAAVGPERRPELELEIAVRIGRDPETRITTRRAPERDLLFECSICRQHGLALVGPDPAVLIGEVPTPWLLEVGAAQLEDWLRLDFEPKYAELMVFSACRVWRLAVEGCHSSKTAAATWALTRQPHLEVVRAAVDRRSHAADVVLEEMQVRALLAMVLARLV